MLGAFQRFVVRMMAELVSYVDAISVRMIGDSKKQYFDAPSWDEVFTHLKNIEEGKVEFLSLIGPENESTHMAILAKPGNYHVGIFIDEDEEYIFKASEVNGSKVDIAGEYWPDFQICRNWNDLVSITKVFFEEGKPSGLYDWIYYCDED